MSKYCSKCGSEVNVHDSFCNNCGNPLNGEDVRQNNNGTNNYNINQGNKSKIAAGLFGIFLGAFGVHNFYLGYTGKAVAQLLITVLSCGILSFISGIWGLIEGILILASDNYVDSDGNLLV